MTTILEMQKKYPWTTAMREMSGMGGNYEEACRKMLYMVLLIWKIRLTVI